MISQNIVKIYAERNNMDEMDLDYAVKSLICKEENWLIEAEIYADLVKEKSQCIWDVAIEVHKSFKEGCET